jgi:hypothetical protein
MSVRTVRKARLPQCTPPIVYHVQIDVISIYQLLPSLKDPRADERQQHARMQRSAGVEDLLQLAQHLAVGELLRTDANPSTRQENSVHRYNAATWCRVISPVAMLPAGHNIKHSVDTLTCGEPHEPEISLRLLHRIPAASAKLRLQSSLVRHL